jgi:hypothetical protein
LNGEGLPPNKKPFFISLPVDRNLDPKEFKTAIRESYLSDYQALLKTKFDEKYIFKDYLFVLNIIIIIIYIFFINIGIYPKSDFIEQNNF